MNTQETLVESQSVSQVLQDKIEYIKKGPSGTSYVIVDYKISRITNRLLRSEYFEREAFDYRWYQFEPTIQEQQFLDWLIKLDSTKKSGFRSMPVFSVV